MLYVILELPYMSERNEAQINSWGVRPQAVLCEPDWDTYIRYNKNRNVVGTKCETVMPILPCVVMDINCLEGLGVLGR